LKKRTKKLLNFKADLAQHRAYCEAPRPAQSRGNTANASFVTPGLRRPWGLAMTKTIFVEDKPGYLASYFSKKKAFP
jgi:hypothetical protein